MRNGPALQEHRATEIGQKQAFSEGSLTQGVFSFYLNYGGIIYSIVRAHAVGGINVFKFNTELSF